MTILKNLTGEFPAYSLSAILGRSGSGKALDEFIVIFMSSEWRNCISNPLNFTLNLTLFVLIRFVWTTLLNILTGNNRDLEAFGNIMVNDVSVRCNISKIAGYVRQEDLFLGELTVLEHLRFRSKIINIPISERETKIQNGKS